MTLLDVLLIVLLIALVVDNLKVVNEVFELVLDIICVDVSSPNDLGVGTVFSACHVVKQGSVRVGISSRIGLGILVPGRVESRRLHHSVWVEEATLLLIVRHESRGVEHTAKNES